MSPTPPPLLYRLWLRWDVEDSEVLQRVRALALRRPFRKLHPPPPSGVIEFCLEVGADEYRRITRLSREHDITVSGVVAAMVRQNGFLAVRAMRREAWRARWRARWRS